MKKFICMILLFTLSSSSVMAQFADQMTKEISVTNDERQDFQRSHFIFLSQDRQRNIFVSDSLKNQSSIIWYPWDYKTILIQTLAGVLGLFIGGGIFVLLTLTACHEEQCFAVLVISGAVGSILGLSFTVDMSGDGHGGNGNFGLTLLGSLVGAASFYGLINLFHPDHINDSGYIYLLPMSIAGAIVGYHISASPVITTNRTSLMQFEKNQFVLNVPSMKLNRYEYPTTSYGISANVLSIHF